MRRWSNVILLTAVALLLTGCGLLFPSLIGSSSSGIIHVGDPGSTNGFPTVRATYTTGEATLKVTQGTDTQTITLGQVGLGSQLTSVIGAGVTWRNADGWALQLMAFDPSAMGGSGLMPAGVNGQLTIERINGNELWTTQDFTASNRCIVTVDQLTEKAVSGTATCKGLRWVDGFASGTQFGLGAPPYIDGQAPFDVEVTFGAKP